MSVNVQTKSNVSKQVAFLFDEGGPIDASVLGGKGAGLVELVSLGVPVPAGFTVTTSVARAYAQHGVVPKRLGFHIEQKMRKLEKSTGKGFGFVSKPLLVSVRSGARDSMPGMLDTVLNLGMTPDIALALAESGDPRFAWDSYRRFLSMFGDVVLGMERSEFEAIRKDLADRRGVDTEELAAVDLRQLCFNYRDHIAAKQLLPDDVRAQLDLAVEAVLRSWNNPRAVEYRRIHRIDNSLGTAVNVQSMVFGNRDENSCSGVVFSRNCTTGDDGLWGEYLVRSQGEDVVAGIRTPLNISAMQQWNPAAYEQLVSIVESLDRKRNAPVDVEFTVESGKLYILQVRNAKLTAEAAATTAVRLHWGKRLSKAEALKRVKSDQVDTLRLKGFRKDALDAAMSDGLTGLLVGRGQPASAGAAVGRIVTTSEAAVEAAARGEKVVLLRPDTSPDDLPGMQAAVAIVTTTGGFTSHAAVVARGLGKPAVVGCSGIVEELYQRHSKSEDRARFGFNVGASPRVQEPEIISVDGNLGAVFLGALPMDDAVNKKEVNIFLKWVAQEEAKRWPAPRLNFAYFDEEVAAERLIADYYISDALSLATKGTALEAESVLLRTRVHTAVAERLAMYLIVAVGGEMRHVRDGNMRCLEAVQELFTRFKVERTGSHEHRSKAQKRTLDFLKGVGAAEHIRFAELCEIVFNQGSWSSSFGGPKWGAIAGAAYKFLSGKSSHSEFADHAFDLQHNGGTVFGKHPMIKLDRYNVHELLNLKKFADNVEQLYSRLTEKLRYSGHRPTPEVVRLYERGRELSLWGQRPVVAKDKTQELNPAEFMEEILKAGVPDGSKIGGVDYPKHSKPDIGFWDKYSESVFQHEVAHFVAQGVLSPTDKSGSMSGSGDKYQNAFYSPGDGLVFSHDQSDVVQKKGMLAFTEGFKNEPEAAKTVLEALHGHPKGYVGFDGGKAPKSEHGKHVFEMVINTNPTEVYPLDEGLQADIVKHVLGHEQAHKAALSGNGKSGLVDVSQVEPTVFDTSVLK